MHNASQWELHPPSIYDMKLLTHKSNWHVLLEQILGNLTFWCPKRKLLQCLTCDIFPYLFHSDIQWAQGINYFMKKRRGSIIWRCRTVGYWIKWHPIFFSMPTKVNLHREMETGKSETGKSQNKKMNQGHWELYTLPNCLFQ